MISNDKNKRGQFISLILIIGRLFLCYTNTVVSVENLSHIYHIIQKKILDFLKDIKCF